MAGFSDAPAEVIDNIVRFVIRRADLANLCLVNKALHRSAVAFLYSSIKITWDQEHPNPSISPLIRTLAQSPELVILIDEIYLFGEYLSDTAERPSLNTTGIPLDQFINIINKSQVPYANTWVDGLKSGNMDAFAGLLIANLSKITSLKITHNFINGDDILGKVLLSKVFGELPAFERLRKMSYVKRMDRGNWERNQIVEYVASLFHIPTVTDMSVSLTNQPFEWPRGEPDLDCLTSLHIEWAIGSVLAEVLLLTPNLKSLSWRWIYHDSVNDEREITVLDYDQVFLAVSLVEETLEKLVLSMVVGDDDYDRIPVGMDVRGSFSRLSELERLKELSIPMVCLAGFGAEPIPLKESLPDSLEVLHLGRLDLIDFGIKLKWMDNYNSLDEAIGQMMQSLIETHTGIHIVTSSVCQKRLELRTKRCAPGCHT
ncbi:unnamed protein product [Clonostachys rhizophaga]|uniref:F-box domain-containing protein n=1 Tax=Clonostachys rhizophaga TaxID=160324 RepID=A0A9N9UXU9_9HYPO|nr:unnamed protein product [Clonostachys rhizophaga]